MRCSEIQIGGNSFMKILYFLGKSSFFNENHSISAKNTNFCEFCEKDARFPWVEFVDFPKNSLTVHEKRTISMEKKTQTPCKHVQIHNIFTKNTHVLNMCVFRRT